MTVFTKDPRSPKTVAALKERGEVLIEVTTKRLFIIDAHLENLDRTMYEWFVEYEGRSHAFRDGCHIFGADQVQEVKVLTEEGRVIAMTPVKHCEHGIAVDRWCGKCAGRQVPGRA